MLFRLSANGVGLHADSISILGHTLNRRISNGVIQEGENNTTLVYFTTRQSFASIAEDFKRTPSFIVWDECHRGDAGNTQQAPTILHRFRRKKTKIIGLTATPKINSCTFSDADVVYSKTLTELISLGFLAKPIPIQRHTHIDWSPETGIVRNSDFTNQAVLNTPERNLKIVKHYVENKHKYGKTIVFAIDIQHVESLVRLFHDYNVTATAVHSNMNAKFVQRNIEDFREGRKDVIINVGILTEGFDAPETETIFLCRPTNSKTLYLQSIGRGTRIPDGSSKNTFYAVDFVDNLTRHQDSLVTVRQFFSSGRTITRPRPSNEIREKTIRGEHFFQTSGTPLYLCCRWFTKEPGRVLVLSRANVYGD